MVETFKDRLKKARKEKGFTQTKVSEHLGIAQASYIRYEKGTSEPNMENLAKICDLLDLSADYLIGREDFMQKKISIFMSRYIKPE